MAHVLGSLDPAICARFEKSKALLIDKSDPDTLSQVLLEVGLLAPKAWKNMVFIFYFKFMFNKLQEYSSLHALFQTLSSRKC